MLVAIARAARPRRLPRAKLLPAACVGPRDAACSSSAAASGPVSGAGGKTGDYGMSQHGADFGDMYTRLRTELVNDLLLGPRAPEFAKKRITEVLDYNVPGGKATRGKAVRNALAELKQGRLSHEDELKACVLGWCIEWLQAFFLVADDLMDGSMTRRGQPAWFRQPGVGMIAINDSFLLEGCVYRLLRKYLSDDPAYVPLLELFHDTTHRTVFGQLLDLTTAPAGPIDLERYTLDNYSLIVRFKTAYYSFYMPVACGMLLAGVNDAAAHRLAEATLLDMGELFQVQDDFLDAYGDPAVTGKLGSDIEDNKCSWLICVALLHASVSQRDAIRTNYGRKDAEAVAAVKRVYSELELGRRFREYEEQTYQRLCSAIESQVLLPKEVFMSLLRKIYKRVK